MVTKLVRLTTTEAELIWYYRHCGPDEQKVLLQLAATAYERCIAGRSKNVVTLPPKHRRS